MPVQSEQVNAAEQGSGGGPQTPVVQRQSEQLLPVGPLAVPVAHSPLDSHQPQPPRDAHESQLKELAQGSDVTQSLPYQFQSEHELPVGPVLVPVAQLLVSSHQ